MNYTNALYRRNNKGRPCYWICSSTGEKTLEIRHGIVGMAETKECIETHRNAKDECESRIKDKRKSGYKYLSEIKDSDTLPVEGELYTFLDSYLPTDRTTSDGMLLPMLAKAYDNKNNIPLDYLNGKLDMSGWDGFSLVQNIDSTVTTSQNLFSGINKKYTTLEVNDELFKKLIIN